MGSWFTVEKEMLHGDGDRQSLSDMLTAFLGKH